ncbi:MAG: GNAT family N-acetyltransferase [Burkholderiaceae bacterium]
MSAAAAGCLPAPPPGARVRLRRLRTEDLADFQAYRSDPEVGRYQGWRAQADEGARGFLLRMSAAPLGQDGEWFQLGIAERAGDRLIGDVGVCRRRADDGVVEAEIGFSLARPAQGRGLAAEALGALLCWLFDELAVARVVAVTDARNRASIALLQRLGARLARSDDAALFRGEPCVEHHFVFAAPRNKEEPPC